MPASFIHGTKTKTLGRMVSVGGVNASTSDGITLTEPTRLVMKSGSTIIHPLAYSGGPGVLLSIGEGKHGAILISGRRSVHEQDLCGTYASQKVPSISSAAKSTTLPPPVMTPIWAGKDSYGYYGLYGGHYAFRNWFGLGHDRLDGTEQRAASVSESMWSARRLVVLPDGGEVRGSVFTVGNQFYGNPEEVAWPPSRWRTTMRT